LGGIIVSINNKLIINRDILSSKIKIPFIAKFIFSLNIKKTSRNLFFLEDNTRIYKERILLELESDNESALKELLSEITSLGSCFNFYGFLLFFLVFFLEGLRVFEEYWERVVLLSEVL
jgi:hypothetical protein